MNTSLQLLTGSLGWTLLHFCWQAAAIALVYGAIDRAIRRASSQTRYLLSLLAIVAMFAASLATLGYEVNRNHMGMWAGDRSNLPLASNLADLPLFGATQFAVAAPVTATAASIRVSPHAVLDFSPVLPWLDVAWLLGVLCLSGRTVGGWWWIQRLRASALADAPASVLQSLSRVRERLGMHRRVDLRVSGVIPGPMTIGVLRSLILLPASALLALNPEQMEAVLAHELAHVRRADYFWNLIQTMIENLFFFHPAVWWVSRRVREQRELCCDDIAVDFCTDPVLYATALLSMEEQRDRRLDLAMALNGQRSWSGLRVRIARLLGEASPFESQRGITAVPLAALCAAMVLLLLPAAQLFASLLNVQSDHSQISALSQVAAPAEPAPAPAAPSAGAQPAPSSLPEHAPNAAPNAPRRPVPSTPPHAAAQPVPQADPAAPELAPSANGPETFLSLNLKLQSEIGAREAALRARASQMQATMGVQVELAREMSHLQVERAMGLAAAQAALPAPDSDYIRQMRAAGYDLPAEKYFDFKVLGITPEYARSMQNAGLGKPSLGNLLALKSLGITPGYLKGLRAAGVEVHSFQEAIEYKALNVSAADIAQMKTFGFGPIDPHEILLLHSQGITPEYAAQMRKEFPNLMVGELLQLRMFKIDDAFIADARRHNFAPLTAQTLVKLRISGLLDNDGNGHDK